MADPAMEHHCLKGFPNVGELRTIWKKKYREYEFESDWFEYALLYKCECHLINQQRLHFSVFFGTIIDFFFLSFACHFSRFGCNSEFYFIPKKVLHDMILHFFFQTRSKHLIFLTVSHDNFGTKYNSSQGRRKV